VSRATPPSIAILGLTREKELVRSIDGSIFASVCEDRLVVTTVRGEDKATAARQLRRMLAHQAFDFL